MYVYCNYDRSNIYCKCGHAIISHDPARETFKCCVKGCDCKQFKREVKEDEEESSDS